MYSSSPSTALYIAAKSITGTVRVPSMSKTTPLKRALGMIPVLPTEVKFDIDNRGDKMSLLDSSSGMVRGRSVMLRELLFIGSGNPKKIKIKTKKCTFLEKSSNEKKKG